MAEDPLLALGELATILERLGLRYAVGGSLASSAWGEPRSTHDVDLLIELPEHRIGDLYRALERSFHVDEQAMRSAVRDSHAFNVVHLGAYYKLDLFVAGPGALDSAQLESAVARGLGAAEGRSFFITAPEVLVVRKLDWFDRGGRVSERQWRDVLSVLRVQTGRLDLEAMRDLARATGVQELLESAIEQSAGSDDR